MLDLKGRIACDVAPQLNDAVGRLRARRLQGAIKLARIERPVFDILIHLGLVRVFETCDSEVEAIGSFQPVLGPEGGRRAPAGI